MYVRKRPLLACSDVLSVTGFVVWGGAIAGIGQQLLFEMDPGTSPCIADINKDHPRIYELNGSMAFTGKN